MAKRCLKLGREFGVREVKKIGSASRPAIPKHDCRKCEKTWLHTIGPFRMVLFPDRHVPRKPCLGDRGKGHNIKAYYLTGKPGLLRPGASVWNAERYRLGNPSPQ
jgi:hypothetical protein